MQFLYLYYPHTRVLKTPVGFSQACMYVNLSVSLSSWLIFHGNFWLSLARPLILHSACGRRPKVKNTLSGSIIFPSVHPYTGLCDFCTYINVKCVGPALQYILWHCGPEDPSGVQSRLCVNLSVSLSLCISICVSIRFSMLFLTIKACGL